ncbi:hypothetical protein PGTUg99_036911 [Puccinia graminis f. sp. tritici]|uniref:Uncharacterized protein n=1 Tax=Puccinia graminis f. sp. tritici TaxID=56615 RepID=A0A5B0NNV8_PUCGR|nr:hypothetical protein PGTUg99_036911 [Puccinia graminis f. sp. tritici]
MIQPNHLNYSDQKDTKLDRFLGQTIYRAILYTVVSKFLLSLQACRIACALFTDEVTGPIASTSSVHSCTCIYCTKRSKASRSALVENSVGGEVVIGSF